MNFLKTFSYRCLEKYNPNSTKKCPKGCSETDIKNLKQACIEADKAFNLTLEDRTEVLVDFNNFLEESKTEESSPG